MPGDKASGAGKGRRGGFRRRAACAGPGGERGPWSLDLGAPGAQAAREPRHGEKADCAGVEVGVGWGRDIAVQV